MLNQSLVKQLRIEYDKATSKFPPMRSAHEGMAIIREEYLELEKQVFQQFDVWVKANMRKEALHVAAMALRFINDVVDN